MTNNQQHDASEIVTKETNQCPTHNKKLLKFICLNCKEIRTCSICNDENHKGHNILMVKNEFRKKVLPFLDLQIKGNNLILNKSNESIKEIIKQNEINKTLVKNRYSEIIKAIKLEELSILESLENQLKSNIDTKNKNNEFIIKQNQEFTTLIDNKNEKNQNVILDNYFKLKEMVSTENQNSLFLSSYNTSTISFRNLPINNCNIVKKKLVIGQTTKEEDKWIEDCLYINKDSKNISIDKKYKSLALSPEVDISELVIPSFIEHVLLLDGYKMELKNNSIKNDAQYSLHIFNIKSTLSNDSIPPNITTLYLHDGFNQSLNSFIKTIKTLHLYDIGKDAFVFIPSCVETVHFHNEFKQPIKPGLLNKFIKCVHFYANDENIIEDSIPPTVEEVNLHDGFKQELVPNFIQCGVEIVKLHDIMTPLKVGSIPSSVKEIHLCNGFNQSLEKGFLTGGILAGGALTGGVENLYIYKIKSKLIVGSIPNSVKLIHFHDGYDKPIDVNVIPPNVKFLNFGDIQENLMVGSIPSTVESVYIKNASKLSLSKDILPIGLKYLEIENIKTQLNKYSIPVSVESVSITGYNYSLDPGILPNSLLTELKLNNLKKPLKEGSIPGTIKNLCIGEMDLSIKESILNNGIEEIKLYAMNNITLTTSNSIPTSVKKIIVQKSFKDIFEIYSSGSKTKILYT